MNTDIKSVMREIDNDNSSSYSVNRNRRRNRVENVGSGATVPLTPTHSLYLSLNPNEHSQDNIEHSEVYLSILLCR